MKKYFIGIVTGVLFGVSCMMFLGSSSISSLKGRYEYISGSTVDMKIFDNGKYFSTPNTLQSSLHTSSNKQGLDIFRACSANFTQNANVLASHNQIRQSQMLKQLLQCTLSSLTCIRIQVDL